MNLDANKVLKINEIFSRVIDCEGNLKVFGGFDWSLTKTGGKFNSQNLPIVYNVEYKDSKFEPTFDENKALAKQSDKDFLKTHKNGLDVFYKRPEMMFDLCKADIKTLGITASNFKIGDIKNNQNIDQYFSVLLNKFPNEIKKDDLVILYTAFYELLQVCDFDTDSNDSIFYLNIFQRLIDYFKDGKINFGITGGTVKQIDNALTEKLEECYEINKLFCKIKTSQSLDNLNDDEKSTFNKYGYLIRVAVFAASIEKCSKNIIFYGAPGTGKTKFVVDCLDAMAIDKDHREFVQFHSSFEYEDFIDGIKPIGIQNGNLNLALTNGVFKEFCLKAAQNTDGNFFFVVDEINRADIAAVFGETLSLLEENYRGEKNAIKIKNSTLMENIIASDASKKSLCIDYDNLQTKFYIPKNIYFIGMMNDVDKSIDCFDLALRRRFTWVLMECDYDVLNDLDKNYSGYKEKCENLNKYITSETYELNGKQEQDGLNLGRAYEIGHSYFLKKDDRTDEQVIWDRHIEPILREYVRTQFSDGEVEKKLETAKKIFVG